VLKAPSTMVPHPIRLWVEFEIVLYKLEFTVVDLVRRFSITKVLQRWRVDRPRYQFAGGQSVRENLNLLQK
jgi:hypothetical protein